MSTHEIHDNSDERYLAVMREAFPGPEKGKIAASVSAQIKAIERKRRIRRGFVKFGSIAACFAVVVFAGFRVIPMLDAKNYTNEAAPQMAADTSESIIVEEAVEALPSDDTGSSDNYSDSDSAAVTEKKAAIPEFSASASLDCVLAGASNVVYPIEEAEDESADDWDSDNGSLFAAAAPILEAAEAEEEEEAIPEDAADSVSLEPSHRNDDAGIHFSLSAAGSGAARELPRTLTAAPENCEHSGVFINSYHDIPKTVLDLALDYVSSEQIMEWYDSVSGTCGMNISAFLKMAGIPKEDFVELYENSDLWYHHDYNAELLYGGDDAAIADYYKNGGSREVYEARYAEYKHKLELYKEVGGTAYSDWADAHGYTCMKSWTLDDFYEEFGIR